MELNVVVIIIRDTEGRFFVHQRSSSKETFPGLYGLGAGGRTELGEEPYQTARRELKEETGLDVPVQSVFEFDYADAGESRSVHVFEATVPPCDLPTDAEWQWSGWMTKQEVDELNAASKLCPDTAVLCQRFLAQKGLADSAKAASILI